MGDIVFVDTETLGLDIASPIWEFAAIRRFEDDINGETTESEMHLFIHHDPGVWLDTLREDFLADYSARFDETGAFCKASAARTIASFLSGQPTLVGAVPDFDTNRIRHQLLTPVGIPEPWHYHLVDVENLIVGYLAGRGTLLPPPWDRVSSASPWRSSGRSPPSSPKTPTQKSPSISPASAEGAPRQWRLPTT